MKRIVKLVAAVLCDRCAASHGGRTASGPVRTADPVAISAAQPAIDELLRTLPQEQACRPRRSSSTTSARPMCRLAQYLHNIPVFEGDAIIHVDPASRHDRHHQCHAPFAPIERHARCFRAAGRGRGARPFRACRPASPPARTSPSLVKVAPPRLHGGCTTRERSRTPMSSHRLRRRAVTATSSGAGTTSKPSSAGGTAKPACTWTAGRDPSLWTRLRPRPSICAIPEPGLLHLRHAEWPYELLLLSPAQVELRHGSITTSGVRRPPPMHSSARRRRSPITRPSSAGTASTTPACRPTAACITAAATRTRSGRTPACMTYGDGSEHVLPAGVDRCRGPRDVARRDSRTANLTYSGESGGLNEATSDIFGTMVEFYANGSFDVPDYKIGEMIYKSNWSGDTNRGSFKPTKALRYMYNPSPTGRLARPAGPAARLARRPLQLGHRQPLLLSAGRGLRTRCAAPLQPHLQFY